MNNKLQSGNAQGALQKCNELLKIDGRDDILRDKDIYVSNCDYLDDLLSDSQDIKSYVKTLK